MTFSNGLELCFRNALIPLAVHIIVNNLKRKWFYIRSLVMMVI